ncbi:hypothetical protein ACTD5D_00390 [Nocardia takedensis]|uniref:hypothetical protein n=1 Tax=Nocardia takedensis TaxID=259390 RepID=UPI003F764E04
MITDRERIAAAAAAAGWSPMVRPYATMYHRGGLVLTADCAPDDAVVAGWWSYTVPGLGQLAFGTADAPYPGALVETLTGWLGDPAALINTALDLSDTGAARLLAVWGLLEDLAAHPEGAVLEARALGRALLHLIAPEQHPDPCPLPLPPALPVGAP